MPDTQPPLRVATNRSMVCDPAGKGPPRPRLGRPSGPRGGVLPVFLAWGVALFLLGALFAGPAHAVERSLLSQAEWALVEDDLVTPWSGSVVGFHRIERDALNLGPTKGHIWLRLTLSQDDLRAHGRWLSLRWPYFHDLRVYLVDPRASRAAGAAVVEVREAAVLGGQIDLPHYPGRLLPAFEGERQVWIHAKADGPAALALSLGKLENERAQILVRYTLFGIYFGAMLGMALYSLFLMVAVRERIYLGYAAFMVSLVIYVGVRHNILTPFFPPFLQALPPASRSQLAVALAALMGIWFVRRFLRSPSDDRLVDRVLLALALVAVASVPVSLWLAGLFSFLLVAAYSLAAVMAVIWGAVRAMRRGFGPAGFLLLAWSVFALGVLLYLGVLLGVFPYAGWVMLVLPMGSLALALLLAFALGNRIRHKHAEEAVLARERDRYRFLSERDGLTGLFNRRALDGRLEAVVGEARRNDEPLSVIVLDTDWFKDYNDRYGHLAGDDALRCLARVMKDNVRQEDECFRYGGEEFVILLPGHGLREATVVAERIREAYPGRSASELGPGGTVSIGVTQFRQGDTPNTFLARGDAALYHAKDGGRNRVELAH